MYVQDAVGVVLVYDMTLTESIEGVKSWYNMVQEHLDMDTIVIALVGNKSDMVENIEISSKDAK